MKKIKDDLGGTIDSEDNLAKMILIESSIDAAEEIDEEISKSYAFCDCIIGIVEFAREVNNDEVLGRVPLLLEKIKNTGALVRALSYYAISLASFDRGEEAEEILFDAIRKTTMIKDDFDRRDALLDLATSAADLSVLLNNNDFIDTALNLSEELTKGQKSYLYGYLSMLITGEESISLMREAVDLANDIDDPITRSKVFLELSSLQSNIDKKFEN